MHFETLYDSNNAINTMRLGMYIGPYLDRIALHYFSCYRYVREQTSEITRSLT